VQKETLLNSYEYSCLRSDNFSNFFKYDIYRQSLRYVSILGDNQENIIGNHCFCDRCRKKYRFIRMNVFVYIWMTAFFSDKPRKNMCRRKHFWTRMNILVCAQITSRISLNMVHIDNHLIWIQFLWRRPLCGGNPSVEVTPLWRWPL
jgi:hypothetical protein